MCFYSFDSDEGTLLLFLPQTQYRVDAKGNGEDEKEDRDQRHADRGRGFDVDGSEYTTADEEGASHEGELSQT